MFNFHIVHFFIGLIGFLLLKPELEKTGNKRLLNQFDTGVFLVCTETGKVRFHNKAGAQYSIFTEQLKKRGKEENGDMESFVLTRAESLFTHCKRDFLQSPERYTLKEILS